MEGTKSGKLWKDSCEMEGRKRAKFVGNKRYAVVT